MGQDQRAGTDEREEQLRGEPAGSLQDRLIKEMRVAGIDNLEAANRFLEITFLPQWEERFTVAPRQPA